LNQNTKQQIRQLKWKTEEIKTEHRRFHLKRIILTIIMPFMTERMVGTVDAVKPLQLK
jgi:hypothetical protein